MVSAEVVRLAVPFVSAAVARTVAPSRNVTPPVGVPDAGGAAATLAVKVTVCPYTAGLAEEATTVVVALGPLTTKLAANSDVLPLLSVAVAVTESPPYRPLTVSEPLRLPLPSAVRNPR